MADLTHFRSKSGGPVILPSNFCFSFIYAAYTFVWLSDVYSWHGKIDQSGSHRIMWHLGIKNVECSHLLGHYLLEWNRKQETIENVDKQMRKWWGCGGECSTNVWILISCFFISICYIFSGNKLKAGVELVLKSYTGQTSQIWPIWWQSGQLEVKSNTLFPYQNFTLCKLTRGTVV